MPPRPPALPAPPTYPIAVDQVVIEIASDPSHPGGRLVLQDGVESSYIDIANPARLGFEYQRHLASVIDAAHPRRRPLRALQIGGGPCAVPRYLEATRRDVVLGVVEIDPGVVEVAERYLGLSQSERLRVVVGDGRDAIAAAPAGDLDVLIVDAFLGLVVPHRLVTAQFTALARRALTPDGIHIVNLIDIAPLGFATAVAATLADHYASVVALGYPDVLDGRADGNVVLAASDRELPTDVIVRRAALDDDPWQVRVGRALTRWIGDAGALHDGVAPTHDLARFGDLFGRTRRRTTDGGG